MWVKRLFFFFFFCFLFFVKKPSLLSVIFVVETFLRNEFFVREFFGQKQRLLVTLFFVLLVFARFAVLF